LARQVLSLDKNGICIGKNRNTVFLFATHDRFRMQLTSGGVATEQVPNLKDVSLPVLERYMKRLFKLADTDGNGVLDHREFAQVRS